MSADLDTKKPKLYIGIETTVRELDAKLLLACVAAEAGFEVWLGQQKMFLKRLETLPPGILLNKSISPSKSAKYAHYHRLGFPLVAYDEEGLAPFNADEYLKRRVAVKAVKPLEYFFAWGEWQRNVIGQKIPGQLHKIIPVGHPRVDLTRREVRELYRDEADELRSRYGAFVLINTNFAFFNHFRDKHFEDFLAAKARAGKVVDEGQRNYYRRVHTHKKNLFYAFAEMVVKVRERFPDLSVILRPHPSEDHDYWRQNLPNDPKVQVVHEGTVLPWILASEVMIHNSCTTGIEAYLLEQPVISYRPVQEEDLEFPLTNALSGQAFSTDDLLQKMEQIFSREHATDSTQKAAEKRKIVDHYIVGLNGPLSCERIVEHLKRIESEPKLSLASRLYHHYTSLRKLKSTLRKKLSFAQGQTLQKEAGRAQYIRQKFQGLPLKDVQERIGKFREVTHRFATIQVVEIEEDVLNITCEDQSKNRFQ